MLAGVNATATNAAGRTRTPARTKAKPSAAKTRSGRSAGSRRAELTASQRVEEVYWRTRLGLGTLESAKDRLAAWIIPALVGVFAFILRVVHLAHPQKLVFDETYYVKDAYALMTLGYEADWSGDNVNDLFEAGDYSAMTTNGAFVVHPHVGKWMIAMGMRLFGPETGFGWRISSAFFGTLTVILLAWLVGRVLNNAAFGMAAGLFLAVEGQHLVQSRTALLDIFLTFWVVVAMCLVFVDRQSMRAHMARDLAVRAGGKRHGHGIVARTGVRWWLLGAGVAFGLATGVKWSGLYMLAVAGILVVVWDASARQLAGSPKWALQSLVRGAIPAFFAMVGLALVTYVASWWSWLATPGGYKRGWAATELAEGRVPWTPSWLPLGLQDLLDYHKAAYDFHVGVSSEHSYMSQPSGWLLQTRPTSFYWPTDFSHRGGASCGSDNCVEAILSVGNPAIWWLGFLALAVVLYGALWRLDWRAWLVLAGYLGLYVPWFQYTERTIFTFYTVVFSPFVVFALLYAIWLPGHIWKLRRSADDAAAAELAYEAAEREAAALATQSEADAEGGADAEGEAVGAAGAEGAGETGEAGAGARAEVSAHAEVGGEVAVAATPKAGAKASGGRTGAGKAGGGRAGGGAKARDRAVPAGAAVAGTVTVEPEAGSESWAEALERVKASFLGTERRTLVTLSVVTALVLALGVYFWPIYVGDYIPHHEWYERMWFQSWI